MTLSAENAKQEKRAQISDMVGEAKRLGSAILSARTPEEARSILGQLHQLAGSPVAMGSSIARMVVTGCISMGERICEYLQEVAAMEALNQQNEQRYAINANNNEGLAGFLDKKELFGKNEREWFERINPDEKRLIAVLDKQGVKRGEALINGQRLRDSAAIVAAYSEYDTLKKDPKALAEYNKLVYGNENGPTNDAERARGEQRIKDAILDVEGDAAKRAPSPEKQKDAGERVKRDIAKLERADDLERRKKNVPPGMEKAAEQAAEDARKESRKSVFGSRHQRYDDTDAPGRAKAAGVDDKKPAVTAESPARAPPAEKIGQLPAPAFTKASPAAGAPGTQTERTAG